jgi:hypothetical protein
MPIRKGNKRFIAGFWRCIFESRLVSLFKQVHDSTSNGIVRSGRTYLLYRECEAKTMKLSDYHGAVSRCDRCTNWDPTQPMSCSKCFCRGYVAACLACEGKGQVEEPVAGAAKGTMKSTCNTCGGKRSFPVPKPKDWDILHPAEAPALQEAVTA